MDQHEDYTGEFSERYYPNDTETTEGPKILRWPPEPTEENLNALERDLIDHQIGYHRPANDAEEFWEIQDASDDWWMMESPGVFGFLLGMRKGHQQATVNAIETMNRIRMSSPMEEPEEEPEQATSVADPMSAIIEFCDEQNHGETVIDRVTRLYEWIGRQDQESVNEEEIQETFKLTTRMIRKDLRILLEAGVIAQVSYPHNPAHGGYAIRTEG